MHEQLNADPHPLTEGFITSTPWTHMVYLPLPPWHPHCPKFFTRAISI